MQHIPCSPSRRIISDNDTLILASTAALQPQNVLNHVTPMTIASPKIAEARVKMRTIRHELLSSGARR